MKKVLVSACLLGHKVRYDGGSVEQLHPLLEAWRKKGRLVPFCPEVAGGLPVPRPAAEIQSGDGHDVLTGAAVVTTREGKNVTAAFLSGAEQALASCQKDAIHVAILKENSPSCGVHCVHDGGFCGRLHDGPGVTTALLRQRGLHVFNENEIRQAAELLDEPS